MAQRHCQTIASYFMENVRDIEYANKHWSGSLASSMNMIPRMDTTTVMIPAPTYDLKWFFKEGVLIYDHRGSYASDNDSGRGGLVPFAKKGSDKIDGIRVKASNNHNNFVYRNMEMAIRRYCAENGYKVKIKVR